MRLRVIIALILLVVLVLVDPAFVPPESSRLSYAPIPVALAVALISALAAGGGIYASSRQSKKNRRSQEEQNELDRIQELQNYERQRQDNLADWNAQNAYNHPAQQMQRLKEAGLSPNLVYGKGADVTAGDIRGAEMGKVNREAPQSTFDSRSIEGFGNVAGDYIQNRMVAAQTDNLEQQRVLIQKEALLKEAQTANQLQETARSKFALGQAQQLNDSVIKRAQLDNEMTEANIANVRTQTKIAVNADQRAAIRQGADLKKITEEILSERLKRAEIAMRMSNNELERKKLAAEIDLIRNTISGQDIDQSIKKFERDMTDRGVNPKDPWYIRKYEELLMELLEPDEDLGWKLK